LGIGCAKGSVEGELRFEDNDPARTVVGGGPAVVLRYLDAVYGPGRRYDQMLPAQVAKRFARLQRALDLPRKWRAALDQAEAEAGVEQGEDRAAVVAAVARRLKEELATWEAWAAAEEKEAAAAAGAFYIAGGAQPSPADFALWPALHDMAKACGEELLGETLRRYYLAFRGRSSVAKALGQLREE
ncbi:hypothetical protein VTH06DRAFT_7446, partial [Thermothelomyces fergusii]